MKELEHKPMPLFAKLAVLVPLITIVFWLISALIATKLMYSNILSEFRKNNAQYLSTLGKQLVNDIKYADYYQIRRVLNDSYNPSYMEYLSLYTPDLRSIAIIPTQISGKEMLLMEEEFSSARQNLYFDHLFKKDHQNRFHFQYRVDDENGVPLGYLAMGGTTNHLYKIVKEQIISFAILGFIVLLAQIIAIIYVSHIITKPLRKVTQLISAAEKEEPDDLIDTALAITSPKGASSETTIFLAVYQKLLRKIQEHVKRNKEMAVQAAIGKVASHIAHDMRSPLSVIKAALKPELIDDPDEKLLISSASTSAGKLDRMADDLLNYSKARNLERRSVNIAKITNDVLKEIGEYAKHTGKTIKYSVTGDGGICANVDPDKLSRVLANLLTNSVQAIKHKDGKIDIAVSAEDLALKVAVKDNGEGITPEHIKNMFVNSFTFGKKGGSGLGLTYCKNVLEAHDGSVAVKSISGEGSTFTITIPDSITSAPEPEEPEPVAVRGKKIASNKRILVMDDEEEILITWRIMIKEATGRVPMEISQPEKVMQSNIDPKKIDVAIIDYEFRGSDMDGLDIIEFLKNSGIKELYLCTAYYQDKDIKAKADKLGVKRIIPKPMPSGILREIL